jgi:hypothetical protein
MARDRMLSLSDVPLPPSPDATPHPAHRSDVAPRGHSTSGLPSDPRAGGQFEIADAEAGFPPGAFSPDSAIDDQIADLERWAVATEARERRESLRFWILRGGAFLSAVAATIVSALGDMRAATILAGAAALFVAIDAAWPGTSLRSTHKRAVYDLRSLQGTVKLKWDKVRLAYPNPTGARRVANALALLDANQAKRDDIGRYLGSAESSTGVKR